MAQNEIPSDAEVVAILSGDLGGKATAMELCEALSRRHPVLESQIAIQRAADRGKITINRDWSLSVPAHVAVAA